MSRQYSREQIEGAIEAAGSVETARAVLDALGATSGAWYLDKCIQVQHAHRLLSQQVTRKEVVTRLEQRFGLNERVAYRRINEALKKPLS